MSATKTARDLISIPYKIKRSPTDLLKALSKTVELEGNTPHYSTLDDTILTHQNNLDKKKNYLSQAAGIKAAQFIIEKYPTGFMKDNCVPHIPKFFPEQAFTEEDLKYPNEDLIYSMLSWGKFRQAYDTYLKCKDLNIKVSEECKLTILDFLCVNNSKEEAKKMPLQEKWFSETNLNPWELEKLSKLNMQSRWKKNSEAEMMFNELTEKSAQAYCSLIKGMGKCYEEKLGLALFKEMREKGLTPDLSTYNEVIKLCKYEPKVSNQEKTDFIMQILNEIKNNGLRPNLATFNNCLATISGFGIDQNSIVFALNILKEMELLKIEPCLATWNSVIDIFYPARNVGGLTNILEQIVDQVEKADLSKSGLVWQDLNDANFFRNAMDKCLNYGQNASSIHRIHRVLMRNNNIKFLNGEVASNGYFDCYLLALMKYEVPDIVMKEWRTLTPFIHNRGIRIMSRMIQYTVDYQCFDYVPEIWSNFVEGKFRRDKNFSVQTIDQFLSLMVQYEPTRLEGSENATDPLLSQYGSLCEIMMKNYPYIEPERMKRDDNADDNRPVYVFEFQWSPKMISNFFIICAKAGKIELITKEFDTYMNNQVKIPGELSEGSVRALFNAFSENRSIEKAVEVLKLAASYQLSSEVTSYTRKLKSLQNLTVSEKQLIDQWRGNLNKK